MKFIYLLLTYNHEQFIEETFNSTVEQTYRPFDLIISDDSSTDNTYRILLNLVSAYDGDVNIKLVQNDKNLGTINHLNLLITSNQADYYIVGAGDDIARQDKVKVCISAANKGRRFVASNPVVINKNGIEVGKFYNRKVSFSIHDAINNVNCGMFVNAFSADLIHLFGEIDPDLSCEDQTLAFRSLLLSNGEMELVPQPLVNYRSHENNQVKTLQLKGKNLTGKEYLRRKVLLRNDLLNSWLTDSKKIIKNKIPTKFDINLIIKQLENEIDYYNVINACLIEDSLIQRIRKLSFSYDKSIKKNFLLLLISISPSNMGNIIRGLIKIKWWLRKEPIGY